MPSERLGYDTNFTNGQIDIENETDSKFFKTFIKHISYDGVVTLKFDTHMLD